MARGLEFIYFSKAKNTQLMTVSVETVRMAKSRPRKNQSDLSELHLVTYCYLMSAVVYSSKMAVNKLLHF